MFVGLSRIFLLGILIFKGLTVRRLYKSFGVKGLIPSNFSFLSLFVSHPVTEIFICSLYSVFVGFSCIFLLGILIFKGLNALHLYKWFGVKRLFR